MHVIVSGVSIIHLFVVRSYLPVVQVHGVTFAAYVSPDPIPTIVSKATIISTEPIEVPSIPHCF